MNPRRLKLSTILVGLALAGVALLSYTQTWIAIHAESPRGGTVDIPAAGSVAAPAVSALAFAGLALFGAITIAGKVFRIVLGALETVLGACVVAASLVTITGPIKAAQSAITTTTGVDGSTSVKNIVLTHALSPWPFVALLAGVAMALLGVFVIATSTRWPESTRRYAAVRIIDPDAPTDPVVAWDTLTTGSDPTAVSDEPSAEEPVADESRPRDNR